MAGAARAAVARFVAAMSAAGEGLRAGLRADVIVVDAAFLVAFVLGAASHPRAAFLAASVVGSSLQLFALDLLVHVAAATLDHRGLVAGWAFVQMAFGGAHVMSAGTSARELFAADGFADRNRVQTAFAFALDDGLFAAGTGRDQGWREDAFSAGTCVTYLGTGVVVTAELGIANRLAAEPGVVQIGHRAGDLLLLLATVTLVFQRFPTLRTVAHVALLLARVNSAVERFRADRFARDVVLLAALQWLRRTTTPTATLNHRLTRWTRSRMAKQRARMFAQIFPAAQFPARVGHVTAVVLRVLLLATEAVIIPRDLLRHVLAGRTAPTVVRLGRIGPLGGAVQVKNVIAVEAGPNRLRRTDELAAHETLDPARVQLTDQLLALRTLGDDVGLQLFLSCTLPLITIWSTFLSFRRRRHRFHLSLVLLTSIPHRTLFPLILRAPSPTTIPESSSSGVSLPSPTTVTLLLLMLLLLVVVSLLPLRPILLVEPTSIIRSSVIPGIVKVTPAAIPAIIVTAAAATVIPPSSVVPPRSSFVVLPAHSSVVTVPTPATTILLGLTPRLARFVLPPWYELGRGRLQAGRLHVGRRTCSALLLLRLDGSAVVELRDELLEALVILLASTAGRGTFAGVGHDAAETAGVRRFRERRERARPAGVGVQPRKGDQRGTVVRRFRPGGVGP